MYFFVLLIAAVSAACDCLDRDQLGRSTWFLLHELVRSDPRPEFDQFMWSLSELYPCEICRSHISEYLAEHPPEMSEYWMCDFHNAVNVRLGKPVFDCGIKDFSFPFNG